MFVESEVDGGTLVDGTFTDELVMGELGVANRMQAKKLVMAARRLVRQRKKYPNGGVQFDSSAERGPFKFILGKGKAIQAMDLTVATMRSGERAEVICRSDYAYGEEELRRSSREVAVPPYATLQFEIKLLKL